MDTNTINKICSLCGSEASGTIKGRGEEDSVRSIELCNRCARDLLWELTHNAYPFED